MALRQARASWYMLFHQLPGISELVQSQLIPWLWRRWSPGYDGRLDAQRALEALSGPGRRTAALRYYRALVQPWARSSGYAREQRRAAATPKIPTLYLHGRDDGCFLPDHTERARAVLAPGSRVEVIDDAGHFLQLERPEVVNALVGEFIKR